MVVAVKAFVAGFPIHHSLSPHIHQFWLDTHKIKGSYEAIEVTPDDFPAFITSLKQRGFIGGNVTLPHKEQAYLLAQYHDDSARAIGAANSLWFEKDKLWASNSDAYGFARNLDDCAPHWRNGQTALVLGAGGAARAIIFALMSQGFNTIMLANRTRERGEQLAAHFGTAIKVLDWHKINEHVDASDLIINTTSIGLSANDTALELDFSHAAKTTIVTDIVYTPLETSFLKAAKHHDLPTVDGLGMLLHQAVFGFEHWFGVKPCVNDELRKMIMGKLKERAQ